MKRWFRELLHPSEKCARVGHAMRDVEQPVFLYPATCSWSTRYVATEAVEVTPTCRRCGHVTATRVEQVRHLTGLTMSSDAWRRLRRDGRILA